MGTLVFGAFRALPIVAQLVSIAGLLLALGAGYGIWHHKVFMKGWSAHEFAIVREDKRAIDAALAKRAVRNDCLARGLRWSTVTGKCEGG